MKFNRRPAERSASLFSLNPHCTECPELVITDEGITIRENANTVRLRTLITDIGVASGGKSWFRLARLAKTLSSLTLVWLGLEGAPYSGAVRRPGPRRSRYASLGAYICLNYL